MSEILRFMQKRDEQMDGRTHARTHGGGRHFITSLPWPSAAGGRYKWQKIKYTSIYYINVSLFIGRFCCIRELYQTITLQSVLHDACI